MRSDICPDISWVLFVMGTYYIVVECDCLSIVGKIRGVLGFFLSDFYWLTFTTGLCLVDLTKMCF